MKQVLINNDGYIEYPGIIDNATIKIDVSDELFDKLSNCLIGYIWKYDFISKTFSMVLGPDEIKSLRELRDIRCFSIIDNRSQLWYNHLTEEQKQELNTWYQAWLDVTETKIIPEKPEWL